MADGQLGYDDQDGVPPDAMDGMVNVGLFTQEQAQLLTRLLTTQLDKLRALKGYAREDDLYRQLESIDSELNDVQVLLTRLRPRPLPDPELERLLAEEEEIEARQGGQRVLSAQEIEAIQDTGTRVTEENPPVLEYSFRDPQWEQELDAATRRGQELRVREEQVLDPQALEELATETLQRAEDDAFQRAERAHLESPSPQEELERQIRNHSPEYTFQERRWVDRSGYEVAVEMPELDHETIAERLGIREQEIDERAQHQAEENEQMVRDRQRVPPIELRDDRR